MIPSYPCMRCLKVVNWDSAARNKSGMGRCTLGKYERVKVQKPKD
jgi:hypothetical protein